MIRYKIYQNQQKKGLNAGKWFARAVSDETFDLAKLAEHMSKHNSPYSSGVIKGVLTDMVPALRGALPALRREQRLPGLPGHSGQRGADGPGEGALEQGWLRAILA